MALSVLCCSYRGHCSPQRCCPARDSWDGATVGSGNDFLLIDNRGTTEPLITPEQAVEVCKHNFGVGGDGVIFALPGSNGCDHTMRIYNSDGTEPEMCGNGIRCAVSVGLYCEGQCTLAAWLA